jgi:GntP family gluconate:H+ symporter
MSPLALLAIGIAIVIAGIICLRLHAALALLLAAITVGVLTPREAIHSYALDKGESIESAKKLADTPIGKRVAQGFGNACGKIGILIAMAAIIGKCLLDSGGADKIVRAALKLVGEKRAPIAFLGSGFTLGMPVFFDTVFYLLLPLAKGFTARTGKNYLLLVLAIVAGGSMAHSLVPPTPGPLQVASELNVDIGQLMIGGLVVGLFAALVGFAYASWANGKWPIPLRDTPDSTLADIQAQVGKKDSELPPLWLCMLPILLPIILIGGSTTVNLLIEGNSPVKNFFNTFGEKNLALIIAAIAALILLVSQTGFNKEKIARTFQDALAGGGIVILITASGGAFGAILQQTGIGPWMKGQVDAVGMSTIPILLLAFGVTALIRFAQGSATVAMMTTAAILAGLAKPEILGCSPLYLALAIGCGSKPLAWMNDSGFWVVCKLSGLTEGETLRTFSILLTVMGLAGIMATCVLAKLLPLV